MTKPKLLLVEDDPGLARQYRWAFPQCEVITAHTRRAAISIVAKEAPSVAIVDLGLPPDPDGTTEGFATIREILQLARDTKIIVATGNEDTNNGLQAVAMGAFDFYRKPIEIEVLRVIVDRAYNLSFLEAENRRLSTLAQPIPIEGIITVDAGMVKVCRTVVRLAATSAAVLLLGESGTGKEGLAHALHDLGPRAFKPFVPLNCAAIPEHLLESELFGHEKGAFTGATRQVIGKIEMANHGTLFLDEVGDLPSGLQAKLLRFLQDQIIERVGGRERIRVNIRIVCATHQDLDAKMRNGEFREDLFYRLNEVSVRIPPLRERVGDPVLLARFFLQRFAGTFDKRVSGFSPDAIAAIANYDWPGNVRELENRVKRAVIMAEGRVVGSDDLEFAGSEDSFPDLDLRSARMRAERDVLERALALTNGVIAAAAKLLGVSRPTLYALMESHRMNWRPHIEHAELTEDPQEARSL